MNELKYVILIPKGMNVHGARAIIFNGLFNHKDIAVMSCATGRAKVHSAGFLTLTAGEGKIKCFGYSESLNVGSKVGDAEIVERTLRGMHGVFDMIAYD